MWSKYECAPLHAPCTDASIRRCTAQNIRQPDQEWSIQASRSFAYLFHPWYLEKLLKLRATWPNIDAKFAKRETKRLFFLWIKIKENVKGCKCVQSWRYRGSRIIWNRRLCFDFSFVRIKREKLVTKTSSKSCTDVAKISWIIPSSRFISYWSLFEVRITSLCCDAYARRNLDLSSRVVICYDVTYLGRW